MFVLYPRESCAKQLGDSHCLLNILIFHAEHGVVSEKCILWGTNVFAFLDVCLFRCKKYRNKLVRCLHPGLLSVKVDGYLVVTVIRFANPHFGSDIRRHLPVKVGPILNQWNLSVVCVKLYFFCLIFRVPPHPATVGIITCLPGDPHLNQISPLESWEGVRIPMYNTAPLKLTFIATENSVSPPKKNHLPTIHFQGPC